MPVDHFWKIGLQLKSRGMEMKKLLVSMMLLLSLLFFEAPAEAAGGDMIIINKSNNQLAYYKNNKLVKTFKVGTGRKASYTPEGKFKVVNKIKNRPYYSGNIPGGDPKNPLGDRWLGINARGTWGTTYAIHGNNNPKSIGGYVSAGCVRMYDNEVQWLYDQVKVNTPVVITTSKKSFNAIASANGYRPGCSTSHRCTNKHCPQKRHARSRGEAAATSVDE
jgi:hypothetical protein